MEQNESVLGSRGFGAFLKRARENRRLSLDAVEEMSSPYPERLTKSHLSRIENGLALPSFPRLLALGQIYGIPISSLAERFEIELRREVTPAAVEGKTLEDVLLEGKALRRTGRYAEFLALLLALADRDEENLPADRRGHLRLQIANCLVYLQRFETARHEVEALLGEDALTESDRIAAWSLYVTCSLRLGRYEVARLALDRAEALAQAPGTSAHLRGVLWTRRGNIDLAQGRHAEASESFMKALELFDSIQERFEASRAHVMLGESLFLAGRADAAQDTLLQALAAAEQQGYDRQTALALCVLAGLSLHRGDLSQAEAHAIRSNTLARPRDFTSIVFRNCFVLWRVAQKRNDSGSAKSQARALRGLLTRIEENLPEAETFRRETAGGES